MCEFFTLTNVLKQTPAITFSIFIVYIDQLLLILTIVVLFTEYGRYRSFFFLERESKVSFKTCFEITKDIAKNEKIDVITSHIQNVYGLHGVPENIKTSIRKTARFIELKISQKWKQSHRTKKTFLSTYSDWLESEIKLEDSVLHYMVKSSPGPSGLSRKKGRPEKIFSELSTASKKHRLDEILKSRTSDELEFAAGVLRKSSHSFPSEEQKSLAALETLALYADLGLSFRKYNLLRSKVNKLHKDTFSSYYALMKFRNQRLPKEIIVSDSHAQVNLQELCNKTAEIIIGDCIDKQLLTNCHRLNNCVNGDSTGVRDIVYTNKNLGM